MQRFLRVAVPALVLLLIGFGAYQVGNNREATRSEFMMGTYIEAKAYGWRAQTALDKVFLRLKEIERRMTINDQGSEISKVNARAGIEPVKVSPDTFVVVTKALEYARLTDGKFDLTIQPVVSLWKIGSPEARVPDAREIKQVLPLVDYRLVQLDANQQTVYLPRKGMGIDLGGIAKGYAADEAASILRAHGVSRAIITLGGNLYVVGNKGGNEPWKIGIQDPLGERWSGGGYNGPGIVEATDESLVTSGAYERYLDVGDVRYHHILDPETGYPAESDALSTTIISARSIDADALSTSLFILGTKKGLALIETMPGTEAIIIDKAMNIHMTSGVQNRFSLTGTAYKLAP